MAEIPKAILIEIGSNENAPQNITKRIKNLKYFIIDFVN